MQNIRIIEIPPMKAVYSGPLSDSGKFDAFNKWFSDYHADLKNELYPRDFMQYNERLGVREWFYAPPAGADEADVGGFDIVDLPHGLYAVAACLDADLDRAADWLDTYNKLKEWAENNDKFTIHRNGKGKPERYAMFHIVSPGSLMTQGISIEDLYMPIELK